MIPCPRFIPSPHSTLCASCHAEREDHTALAPCTVCGDRHPDVPKTLRPVSRDAMHWQCVDRMQCYLRTKHPDIKFQ